MQIKRLGDLLVDLKLISPEQLNSALSMQKTEKKRLGTILTEHKFITEDQLIEALHTQLGIEYVDLSKTKIDPSLAQLIPKEFAEKETIVPVRLQYGKLYLAMSDPLNFMAQEQAKRFAKHDIVPMIAQSGAIISTISALYGNEGAVAAMAEMRSTAEEEQDTREQESARTSDEEASSPTIKLVNSVIERAFKENASDIHWEPQEREMRVRMRIDGRLHQILVIPKNLQDSVISRLKIMSRLDIVEKRIPQDGRAKVSYEGGEIDLRVSTLPTIYGEKVVIRILRRDASQLNRRGIGLPASEDEKIDKLLSLTSGVIMIVGPTGSGKSSTMYALVNELLSESTNLITLEDPVEYHFAGATQVQINEKVGLTFASGLRSILRQDPDIICVGEIRDGETAEIAMRAAMTGHLVITTIHTENAVSAIDRLKDMNVAPYLIAAGLRGIISQRLLRRNCTYCRMEYQPDPAMIRMAGLPSAPGRKYFRGKGCVHCFHSGYRGRIGVFEVLLMNAKLRECITHNGTGEEFERLAKETGYVPMLENASDLVDQGVTSVEEVARTLSGIQ